MLIQDVRVLNKDNIQRREVVAVLQVTGHEEEVSG
jgi:hypothetical protein